MATAPKFARIRPAKASPLTPELKEFIDRAIVAALVDKYLAESEVAKAAACVAKSPRRP